MSKNISLELNYLWYLHQWAVFLCTPVGMLEKNPPWLAFCYGLRKNRSSEVRLAVRLLGTHYIEKRCHPHGYRVQKR